MRDRVLVRHPLQPYDARNFDAGPAAGERPFSFDPPRSPARAPRAGARGTAPPPFLAGPLPGRDLREDVSLADLKAFLAHPVRAFLRGRLDVSTPFEPDELGDAIPVDARRAWRSGRSATGCCARCSPARTRSR